MHRHRNVLTLSVDCVELGYSSKAPQPSLEERERSGAQVEDKLRHEPEAAPAPAEAVAV